MTHDHNWLRYFVPRDWSGRQGLAAVEFLNQAIDAVWAIHGEAMVHEIGEEPSLRDDLHRFIRPEMPPEDPEEDDNPF